MTPFERILHIAGSDGNEIAYGSFIDWAFNSAKALEHRKDRLREVKLFQPGGPKELHQPIVDILYTIIIAYILTYDFTAMTIACYSYTTLLW